MARTTYGNVSLMIPDKRPPVEPRQCPCGRYIRWGAVGNATRRPDCWDCEEARKDDSLRGVTTPRKAKL